MSRSVLARARARAHSVRLRITHSHVFFCAVSVAGVAAQTVTYPFDVLRRREQTRDVKMRPYGNVFQGLVLLYREGGLRGGLYRGLLLNYLKTWPNVTIYMPLYDFFKQRLVDWKHHMNKLER